MRPGWLKSSNHRLPLFAKAFTWPDRWPKVTIEERILALHECKAALAESMYSSSVGRKQVWFSESDRADLLGHYQVNS